MIKYRVEILFDAGGDTEALEVSRQIENAAYALDGVNGVERGDLDELEVSTRYMFKRTVQRDGLRVPLVNAAGEEIPL